MFLLLLFSLKTQAQNVFINEIHYDNTGSDVAEAIEIAGPAGTDLDGWRLVLYNGSNASIYNTITLTTVLSDQSNGFGTELIALPTNGLQNGAPDGLALVAADGAPSAVVLINEIDADTAGTDRLEFVELYDGGVGNTSLDGMVLVAFNGNGDTSYNAFELNGYTTNEEGYFVLGNEAVAQVDLVVPSNSFQNGADAVALYAGSASDFPNGTAVTTDQLIDAVVYGTNDATDTALLVVLHEGQFQIDENAGGDKDNDSSQRIPNGTGGLRNTATFATAVPTPGASNDAASTPPPPPTGEVIPIATARAAAAGATVTITGTLTVADEFSGSAYLQDSTGAIAIFDALVHGEKVFKIGDSITVTGVRSAFQEQLQLSGVTAVLGHGAANTPIVPLPITFSALGAHPAELVMLEDVRFPTPGDLLFGNANFTLTNASGTGEMRMDNDVTDLVGLAQPEGCAELVGVVGRFRDFYQVLPRKQSDVPCAMPYVAPVGDGDLSKEETFDVATWNIEWFGDESNAPAAGDPRADAIQRDSVRNVLLKLDADVIAVQEIADDVLFAELVNGLPGYDFVLSDAVSNPTGSGVKQKLGFIYKTAHVVPQSTRALLKTIHPAYNGDDDSAIADYPNGAADRFYASGRLPFLLTAAVTINGMTKEMDLIALHARANSSSAAQERYDFRNYDIGVLKDSLDVQFANRNVVLLGDYNDDVDQTVAAVATTASTFQNFVDDPENYTIVTSVLSEAGFRSFVSRENMIDHIMISNELNANYVENSASVGYEFYDNDYDRTASDHLLVAARFVLETPQEESAITSFTLVDAQTNEDILELTPNQSIPMRSLGSGQLNIRANRDDTAAMGSVVLELGGAFEAKRTEGVAPYALFGDLSGNYFGKTLVEGDYTLTATPYELEYAKGVAGVPLTINFSITAADRIDGFTLVDAATNLDIQPLSEATVIDLANQNSPLAISANTSPGAVGSVVMVLDGPIQASRIENGAPYAVFADLDGDYFGKIFMPGVYTLTATPYTKASARGIQGETKTVMFVVVDTSEVVVAPNPIVGDEIVFYFPSLEFQNSVTVPFRVQDQMGITHIEGNATLVQGQSSLRLKLQGYATNSGLYYVSFGMPDGSVRSIKLVRH